MFNSNIFEVILGLVLFYFVVATLCSAVMEWISRIFAMRANNLRDGVWQLLGNNDPLRNKIYTHPLIKGLSSRTSKKEINQKKEEARKKAEAVKNGGTYTPEASADEKPRKKYLGLPSEIPPRTFALALLNILDGTENVITKLPADVDEAVTNIGASIDKVADPVTKQALDALLVEAKANTQKAGDTLKEFQSAIEKWFDDGMQRVTGWYKRKSQLIILILSLGVCFALNLDTFGIANTLVQDNALRQAVVAAAEAESKVTVAEDGTIPSAAELENIAFPVGWNPHDAAAPNSNPDNAGGWAIKIAGILVTACAATLGAPFWFDLVGKFVNLRQAGKKPTST
jgi:hypothetical protein